MCLRNFLGVFGCDNLRVIADRCEPETLDDLASLSLHFETTDLGNAGSLNHVLKLAVGLGGWSYFVEDDYLHKPGADAVLEEGKTFADYVSLYDHPDKYTGMYGFGEVSQVKRGTLSHWRFTRSTCMTFAASADALKKDWEVWERCTTGDVPRDHDAFSSLGENRLAVCIPGVAVHTDVSTPGAVRFMEPWALGLAGACS